ncbi:MAG: Diacetylchitobiose uptake system permease protein NgcG [Candidatus Celerinatantimonas neptuna]|nr:MAG: Diacetylchitobiose uptake system permease protein NgcG [Candidatus Celerinatantimonas neptuna]
MRIIKAIPVGVWLGILLLSCLAILWLSPILWMVKSSFGETLFNGQMASLIPNTPFTLSHFKEAWESADWIQLYANTLFFTFGTLVVQLVAITIVGYVFAYYEFAGKQFLFYGFLMQMMIMPVMVMVPNLLTLKSMGLLDTLIGAMMPYFASGIGIFLMRQTFLNIPKELEDAAILEGACWWQVIWYVLLPMARPAMLAFAVVSVTYHWNEYLWPLMVLSDPSKQLLTIGLVSFAMGAESGGDWGLVSAGTLMVCAPLVIAFLLFQKQFIRSFGFSGIK